MLSRTGLLIVLALVGLFLAGCGGGGVKYENALEVNKIIGHHGIGAGQNCTQIDASKIGANNSIACEINYMMAFYRDIEISTFDGDAKEACENNGLCNQTVQSDDVAVGYLHNALIIIDADDGCNPTVCADAEKTITRMLEKLEQGIPDHDGNLPSSSLNR